MKNIKHLLILILACSLTACIDIVETVTIDKNGKGSSSYEMDMSKILAFMDSMNAADTSSSSKSKNKQLFDGKEKVDSTINFYHDMPDSIKTDLRSKIGEEKMEYFKNINLNFFLDKPMGIFKMKMNIDFDNINQLAEIQEAFSQMDSESKDTKMIQKMLYGGSIKETSFDWKKGVLKRFYVENTSAAEDSTSMENKQMEMLFAQSTYKIIYNLPSKVKKVSNPNALISADGKQVVQDVNMTALKNGTISLENEIVYE